MNNFFNGHFIIGSIKALLAVILLIIYSDKKLIP